jgi:glutathione S-transferase
MTEYRLHYFPESGNSYKLALMLTLCGQRFDLVWTDFGGGVTRMPEWRRTINEMGEIPVLEENGINMTQTAPILLRLADTFGRFGGADDVERQEMLRWLFWDNQKLTGHLAAYRYRRAFVEAPDPAVLAFLKSRTDDFLGIVEQRVQDRPFIVGDHPTVVDLSMCGYLMFPKQEAGYDIAVTHKAVDAWLQRIAALPGWKAPYDLLPGKRMHFYAR